MGNTTKRLLSLLLALIMVIGLMPVNAAQVFAAEGTSTEVALYAGVGYSSLEQALSLAEKAYQDTKVKQTVTLAGDLQADNVVVPFGVALDCNSKNVTVTNLLVFGDIVNTGDSGSLQVSGDCSFADASSAMPVYNADNGSYTLYSFTHKILGIKEKGDTVIFGYAPKFNDVAAYNHIIQGGKVGMSFRLEWTGCKEALEFAFSDELMVKYAQLASKYHNMPINVAMQLSVTGMDVLPAGTKLYVTPVLTNELGAQLSGQTIGYVVPGGEPEAAIFEDNYDSNLWDVSGQHDGYVTVIGGGGAADKPLQFAGSYKDVNLTLNARDYADSTTASRTEFGFEFDVDGDGVIDTAKGDQTVTFGVVYTSNVYRVQTRAGTLLNWKSPYDLTAAEIDQFVIDEDEIAAGKEDGLDLGVIRYGTKLYLFIGGKQVAYCDLTKCANADGDTESGITADTEMFIYLRHFDDLRTPGVKIPFSISTNVQTTDISALTAENGTLTVHNKVNCYVNNARVATTSDVHFVGEKIVLTATPNEGYQVAGVTVDGKDVSTQLISAGKGVMTYAFEAVRASYEAAATFKAFKIFESNYDTGLWDISGQHDGYVFVKGGGGATNKPLQFAGQYQNVDLTLNARDYDDATTHSRTEFGFEFDMNGDGVIDTANGDHVVTLGIADGYRVQTRAGTILNWNSPYDLTQAEKDQLAISAEEVAAGNENGLDLRIVRYGTMMYIFVGGKQVALVDLTKCTNKDGDTESGITADTKMSIYLRHYDDVRKAGVKIPFSISTNVYLAEVDAQTAENGAVSTVTKVNHYVNAARVTTTSDVHFVGEKITVTVTPVLEYKVAGLVVDGNDVSAQLTDAGKGVMTYELVANKAKHTAAATFEEYKVFESNYDAKLWDISGYYDGYVFVNGGGGATAKPLQFVGQYQNVDLTLNARDYQEVTSKSRTEFGFEFDVDGDGVVDQTVTLGIAEGDRIQTRGGTLLSWKTPYDLNQAEKDQLHITAEEVKAGNEDGLDLRVVRYGTMMYLFIEGKQVAIVDLTKCANSAGDTESGITADTKMFIYLRHYDDLRTPGVKIPFSISTDVQPVAIDAQAENGTVSTAAKVNCYVNNARVTTTSDVHFVGEKIAVTLTPNQDDYIVNKLMVNDTDVTEDITANADSSYTYILNASENAYTVTADIYAPAIFKNNYDAELWDLSGQYDGVVALPNGGGASAKPLEFAKKYVNIDLGLTVRDYPDKPSSEKEDTRTDVEFVFDNGQTVTFGVVKTSGLYRIQNRGGTLLNWKTPYFIEDQALIDAYVVTEEELNSGNLGGLNFRIVRLGTEFYLYLNDTMVKGYDFSYKIAEDTPVTVYLRHYDDAGFNVEIPFTVSENAVVSDLRLFAEKVPVTNYAYSFAILPDTQIMVQNDVVRGEANMAKLIDWLIANKESKNIQQVLGLGDITENNNAAEWSLAQEQYAKLDAAGISYSLVRGNHDQSWYRKDENADNYNTDDFTGYMGTEAYRAQFGGFYSEDNIANSWKTLQIGNVKYLLLALDYGANDAVLNWASDIIYQHPDHNVIITTHAYLFRDGSTLDDGDTVPPSTSGGTNNGDDMWDKLVSKHENIVLMMSGHDPYENIVVNQTAGDNGNTVTAMLIDAQDVEAQEGSMGMVAMLYFSEDGKTVQVEYYSTAKEKFFKSVNQFTLELDVVEAAGSSTVPATGAYTNNALTEGKTFSKSIADNQRVTLSDTPYTLSVWLNVATGVTGSAGAILGNYNGNYANVLNFEITNNGNPRLYHRNADNVYDSLVFDKVDVRSNTQWVHVAFVVSGNRVSCYLNGQLKQTLTAAKTIQLESTKADFIIGGDLREGNSRYFLGRILALDLYSGALSAEKILDLYVNGSEAVTDGKIVY